MTFKFGDVLANGYQGEDNPYHKSIFLRKTKRHIHVREFDGRLSEFDSNDHKLIKIDSIINHDKMNQYKEDMRRKKREWNFRK